MGRYVPSAQESAAIDLLTLAGYTVMRERSYEALRDRVRVAEVMADMERERRESCEQWAHKSLDESRRLADRLNAVCTGAATLGVSITAINAALAEADRESALV